MSVHAGDPDDDDDDAKDPGHAGTDRRFGDFDCPDCSANNPYDDAFGNGDEIRCYYCGAEYLVVVSESGRLKLKSI